MESQMQQLSPQSSGANHSSFLNQREQELLSSIRKSKVQSSSNKQLTNFRCDISKELSGTKNKFYDQAKEIDQKQRILQERVNNQIKNEANSKKISKASYKILIEKLEKNLNSCLNEIDESGTGLINFQQLGRTFTLMEVFKVISYNQNFQLEEQNILTSGIDQQNQTQKYVDILSQFFFFFFFLRKKELELLENAWKIFCNETEQVDVKKVFCVFRILLDPAYLDATKSAVLLKDYLEKINPDDTYNFELIQNFAKDFRTIQNFRLSYTKTGYLKPNLAQDLIENYQKTLTFKPKLNPMSELIDSSKQDEDLIKKSLTNHQQMPNRSSDEMEDLLQKSLQSNSKPLNRIFDLYKKDELKKQKQQAETERLIQEEMKECTFQPQILKREENENGTNDITIPFHVRLYQFKSRAQYEQAVAEAQQQREEQGVKECTFYPQVNDITQTSSILQLGIQTEVKGYQQTIQRLRDAAKITNYHKEKINHIPQGEGYEKAQRLAYCPPSMLNRPKQQKDEAVLYIDVNMGLGKVGRLALRKHDNVEKVVKNFAKIWGLGQNDLDKLREQAYKELMKLK